MVRDSLQTMKKNTNKQKLFNKLRHYKQHRLSLRLIGYKKHHIRRKLISKKKSRHDKSIATLTCLEIEVFAPKEFGLINEKNRHLLLDFIKKINTNLSKGYKVNICFKKTTTLLPCGTLWATAKIEKLLDKYPNKLSCSYPEDNIVEQLFQHIGLLQKLGRDGNRLPIEADNVKYWHYMSGSSTDHISKFIPFFESLSLSDEESSGLFDSMSEAVTNAIQHAYMDGQSKEWWMFTQLTSGMLDVAICDFGMGIPCSLKQKPAIKEWILSPIRFTKLNKDKSLISLAVESDSTSTKMPHRGKGLKDMLDLVKNGTTGGFRIFSDKGAFNYDALSKLKTEIDYREAVNGTIIQWRISLEPNHGE